MKASDDVEHRLTVTETTVSGYRFVLSHCCFAKGIQKVQTEAVNRRIYTSYFVTVLSPATENELV